MSTSSSQRHQAPVHPVTLAQPIEQWTWSPQTQGSDPWAVQPVVGPAQVLPGPTGRRVEEVGDIHDQATAPVDHQVAAVQVMAMQPAADGMGEPGINVLDRLERDAEAPPQTVPQGDASQAAQHQVAIVHVEALGKSPVAADAPIHLSLLFQSRPPGRVHLHNQLGVSGMVQHRRIVAAAQGPPGLRQAQHPDRVVRIDAAELQLRKQLVIDPLQQLRQ